MAILLPEMVEKERVTERHEDARNDDHEGAKEDVVGGAVGDAGPLLHAEVDGVAFEQVHHSQLTHAQQRHHGNSRYRPHDARHLPTDTIVVP